MPFRCPACARALYNRRRPDCEFCGAAVRPTRPTLRPRRSFLDTLRSDDAKPHREQLDREQREAAPGDILLPY